MKASGSTMVVSELISQLHWGADNDTIHVTHPDGQYSPVIKVEVVPGSGLVELEIDADPDSVTFRALLDKVTELLNDLDVMKPIPVKGRKALQQRITDLANEIEEAL